MDCPGDGHHIGIELALGGTELRLSAQVPKLQEMASDDIRAQLPRFHNANLEKNLRLRSALKAIARGKNATVAQLSIAWPIAQGKRAGALLTGLLAVVHFRGAVAKASPPAVSNIEGVAKDLPRRPRSALL